ncbi:hypothetical protein SBRY_20966 [Actinacidiphila bryophytorum]|uniref:Uncharacterized protein n=1 Tax=Actinacidiphila bryophytorum TaxID=1436133 RepID=A0A9W4EA39_9ACTN|nr:hypothetical protein SBRY_20966 [Actinacidiphila bryophytorum]
MDRRQRAACGRFPRRALPDAEGLRGRVLPGDQRPDPAGPHRGHQQHTRGEVRRHPVGSGGPHAPLTGSVR